MRKFLPPAPGGTVEIRDARFAITGTLWDTRANIAARIRAVGGQFFDHATHADYLVVGDTKQHRYTAKLAAFRGPRLSQDEFRRSLLAAEKKWLPKAAPPPDRPAERAPQSAEENERRWHATFAVAQAVQAE